MARGRVSLLPRHVVQALPPDERHAVEMLETHLWQRQRRAEPALEVLPDGTAGVFLTIGHVQNLLRQNNAPKRGEDYAAEILNTILPNIQLLQATDITKKPRTQHHHPGEQRETGGRHAVAPLEASSGRTQRHRLDRGGNRQLNAALYRIAITQARYHPAARDYLERKRAEGKSRREAIRCLKRLLIRVIFNTLKTELALT